MAQSQLATFYSLLPQNAKDSESIAASPAKLRELRQTCDNVEMEQAREKLNDAQMNAYHLQLAVYLVLDELEFAKYLVKRVPKEVREKDSFKAIWDVGCSQWRREHNAVYAKVSAGKWGAVLKPLMAALARNYRRKQMALVSKSYTSITLKELLGFYLGLKDVAQLKKLMAEEQFEDVWSFDDETQPTLVRISKKQEDYAQMLDPSRLMSQFTKYVCFMEAQNKVGGDEPPSSASNSKN